MLYIFPFLQKFGAKSDDPKTDSSQKASMLSVLGQPVLVNTELLVRPRADVYSGLRRVCIYSSSCHSFFCRTQKEMFCEMSKLFFSIHWKWMRSISVRCVDHQVFWSHLIDVCEKKLKSLITRNTLKSHYMWAMLCLLICRKADFSL